MKPPNLSPELLEAKRFHGHLGPYLAIGLKMGRYFCSQFGDAPFSFRICTSVGLEPPYSCIIDGLQVSTPCTIGNSMIRVLGNFDLCAWVEKDGWRTTLRLNSEVKARIDSECTRENEEELSQALWELVDEALFEIQRQQL